MIPLQVVAMAVTALGAVLVVATRDVVRQAILVSIYGLSLALLFVVFQAPDVALSGLVVGSVAYPPVLVAALARIRSVRRKP